MPRRRQAARGEGVAAARGLGGLRDAGQVGHGGGEGAGVEVEVGRAGGGELRGGVVPVAAGRGGEARGGPDGERAALADGADGHRGGAGEAHFGHEGPEVGLGRPVEPLAEELRPGVVERRDSAEGGPDDLGAALRGEAEKGALCLGARGGSDGGPGAGLRRKWDRNQSRRNGPSPRRGLRDRPGHCSYPE